MNTIALTENLINTALKQLYVSATFKKKRLAKIARYYDAYAGNYKPKFRQAFNIPLPVFSGLVDTLLADFNDPINLEYSSTNKTIMPALTQANAIWKVSSNSLDPAARWRLQTRLDKKNAIITGVGVQKTYAESDPKFKFYFEAVNLKKFHFEPKGGPMLEKHLFKGQEGIYRTQKQLEDGLADGRYRPEAVKNILAALKDNSYRPKDISTNITGEEFRQFRAFQQDPESNNYTGQFVSSCIEWVLGYESKKYYLLFDPYCQEALIVDELKNIVDSGREPWTAWHTHEDDEVFMSKSYGDDFYPIHDSVCTSINQEFTNRRKKNSNSRYYDDELFTDLTKLDEGQWRDDALIPVDTKGGTRKISEGIYQFDTSEMTGTIDLVNFLEGDLSKNTGVAEIENQPKGKQANVQMTLLQQAEKRVSSKAESYNECYQQIGVRFLDGISEHLNQSAAVELIGSDGYGWHGVPERDRVNVNVVNITEQDKQNVFGKDQKKQALDSLMANPSTAAIINPKVYSEFTLKDIGGWGQEEVDRIMDVENYGIEDIMELAEYCVQRLLKGKMPKLVFNANIAFLKYIQDFEKKNQADLGATKSKVFLDYIMQMIPIVQNNMSQGKPQQSQPPQNQNQNGDSPAGGGSPPTPASTPVSRKQQAPMPKMAPKAIAGAQR